MRVRTIAAVTAVLAGFAAVPVVAGERPFGDIRVFARVGEPGMPEGLLVDGDNVYVGTHTSVRGNAGGPPSKLLTYDRNTAELKSELSIQDQNFGATHGILGMAQDADGRLYVLDRNPPRVIRIDGTTQETYATFPDLIPCRGPLPNPGLPCSPTTLDQAPFPDYPAFDAAGNLYVTDLEQAAIFRVPPGGGPAEVWFTDPRLDGVFGPNGIVVTPSGDRLLFAMTASMQPETISRGVIYSLPITEHPTAADLQPVFTYTEPAAGPDGMALGASGRLYVALAGSNQISVLEGSFCVPPADCGPAAPAREVARFPSAVDNALLPTPVDLPASIAFDGKGSLLVTNQSFFAANSANWVVFDIFVDDTELPLIEPAIP